MAQQQHVTTGPTGTYGSANDLPSFVKMRQELEAMQLLTTFVLRDQRPKIAEIKAQMTDMAERVDAFYERLGARHWTYPDGLGLDKIDAILRETTTPEAAEARLIEIYEDADATRWQLLRLRNIDGLRDRHHLLLRAREDYDAGRYDTCTLLLITVMDGFVNDFEADKRRGLAAREADEMVAWDSVTGHHMGLTNALEPFLLTIKKRVDEEVFEVHRHGIVHGTVVNYNNIIVATKAWNLLLAVVDWSTSTINKAKADAKPPAPGLRATLGSIAELARRKRAREQFEPYVVSFEDGEVDDEIAALTRSFVDAWQRGQWGLLVPRIPVNVIGTKRDGEAARFAKNCFSSHRIEEVQIDRVEYSQSSVAEVRGRATINGTRAKLRLRWIYFDADGDVVPNGEDGTWQLAVIAPGTYLVDENDERLDLRATAPPSPEP